MNRRGPGISRLLDRGLEAPVGAAGVAHAGEAAVEHAEHQPRGARRHQGQRHGFEKADVHFAQGDVDVAVDQAGHHRAPAAVDHVSALRLDRLVGSFPDGVPLDKQFTATLKLTGFGLEQLEIPEQKLRHCGLLRGDHRTTPRGPAQAGWTDLKFPDQRFALAAATDVHRAPQTRVGGVLARMPFRAERLDVVPGDASRHDASRGGVGRVGCTVRHTLRRGRNGTPDGPDPLGRFLLHLLLFAAAGSSPSQAAAATARSRPYSPPTAGSTAK